MFNGLIDFGYLKSRLTPYFLRRPKLTALFASICAPLMDINVLFDEKVDDIEYCLTITGQKIYLEKMLNDCFDEYVRRIRVINNNPNKFLYLYNNEELKDGLIVYNDAELGPVYDPELMMNVDAGPNLLNIEEVNTLYDYTVQYPSSLTTTESEFRNKINKYNPAGRIYNFEAI